MITQPGSFVWLVVHDMRLNWRRFADMLGVRPLLLIGIVVSGAAVLHLAAGRAAIWLSPYVHGDAAGSGPFVAIVVCIFTWMIAQSLFGAMRALYDRGDLDLLLGSPLPARRIFAAKAASITTSTLGSIAFLALPIANTGAAVDQLEWLGIYPALIGLALIATSIALLISIGLFFLVGPRRARMYTQITGAVIGGSFVLGAQVIAMLPREVETRCVRLVQAGGKRQLRRRAFAGEATARYRKRRYDCGVAAAGDRHHHVRGRGKCTGRTIRAGEHRGLRRCGSRRYREP